LKWARGVNVSISDELEKKMSRKVIPESVNAAAPKEHGHSRRLSTGIKPAQHPSKRRQGRIHEHCALEQLVEQLCETANKVELRFEAQNSELSATLVKLRDVEKRLREATRLSGSISNFVRHVKSLTGEHGPQSRIEVWEKVLSKLAPTGSATPLEKKCKSKCVYATAHATAGTAADGDEAGKRLQ
jgi:hypothetical protein